MKAELDKYLRTGRFMTIDYNGNKHF